ncbi:anti-sigma factor domain-containing protein [Sulfobacillus thermosulfidooxidans]|uniref:anti-sigma factor domain-containing protein n=2 Tax=Sulfobacillus thermosulfidooxidans TaxID=28034 RepID=UPI00096B704F|nr:anti-sigma factor [Sulfobacillus thermosulfidooxidans]OLZ11608.1 hypothetical protein BFX05_06315 [Sulfobacillus thermosulfidooxidans]OLZ21040.1 hypothetical protein BFX07_13550 [Sulfobacillus thermosulfidooxidans]
MAHLNDEELLVSWRRYGDKSEHEDSCQLCQSRRHTLLEVVTSVLPEPTQEPSLTATQILSRLASREHTLKVISRRQIAGVAIALMLSSLALLSPSLQKPILPAPVQMAATSLPFASSRVMVEWSPGHKMGKIFASQLKVIPNSVLEVWLIKDRKHVPVAIIPLSSHDETVMFAVPKKARNAEAIGITLEHSPNMPKPTGPRVFYHKFH